MTGDSLHTFQTFSFLHAGTVTFFALLWGVMIAVARRWRDTKRLARAERGFALITLIVWIVAEGYWLLPPRFNVAYTLPLHLCDIAALLVPLALVASRRFLVTLLYFWGLGLSLQAVLTPELHRGPAHFEFWLFWSYHSMIVGTALYFVVVQGFRPTWSDWRFAVLASALYVAVIFPINLMFGYNYGFLGDARPSQPTLIDVLGPWPQRVPLMAGLGLAVMTLLFLPWELHRRLTGSSRTAR